MEDFNNAVAANEIGLVRQYLSENPTYDLEQKDEENELVALHHAIDSGSPDMIRLLLEKGADINAKNIGEHTGNYL